MEHGPSQDAVKRYLWRAGDIKACLTKEESRHFGAQHKPDCSERAGVVDSFPKLACVSALHQVRPSYIPTALVVSDAPTAPGFGVSNARWRSAMFFLLI